VFALYEYIFAGIINIKRQKRILIYKFVEISGKLELNEEEKKFIAKYLN
jgi:hypothetical protein